MIRVGGRTASKAKGEPQPYFTALAVLAQSDVLWKRPFTGDLVSRFGGVIGAFTHHLGGAGCAYIGERGACFFGISLAAQAAGNHWEDSLWYLLSSLGLAALGICRRGNPNEAIWVLRVWAPFLWGFCSPCRSGGVGACCSVGLEERLNFLAEPWGFLPVFFTLARRLFVASLWDWW